MDEYTEGIERYNISKEKIKELKEDFEKRHKISVKKWNKLKIYWIKIDTNFVFYI